MTETYSFSPDGSELACVTPDGRLVLWDARAAVQKPKCEYAPSSHLAAAPTCVAWAKTTPLPEAKAKKKKRRSSSSAPPEDLIAMGTTSGTVLIYSARKADVVASLSAKNAESLGGLAWSRDCSEIFACGRSGTVFRFDFKKSSLVSSFKPDEGKSEKLNAVVVLDDSSLLVSSNVVFWIDPDTEGVLKIFMGHKSEINLLKVLNDDHFVSASADGHVLNVWRLDKDDDTATPAPKATLALNEAAVDVDSTEVKEADDVRIGVVTRSGALKCYESPLGNSKKKALKPSSTVQIATEKDESGKVSSLPILSCKFIDKLSLKITYGSRLHPRFEELKVDEFDKNTCLVRSCPGKKGDVKRVDKNGYASNLMIPDTTDAIAVAPGNAQAHKRKAESNDKKQDSMTMIERLRLLSKDANPTTTPPRTDSLLQLLLQGLHGQDRKILDSVLDRADEELIDNTVKKLPVEAVIPLIKELQIYIRGRGMVNQAHAKWFKSTLINHAAFLMSTPQCEELLGPVAAMLEQRTRNYFSLLHLKGKLDVITKQISGRAEEATSAVDTNKEALLVYHNDSSDDLSDALDEVLLPASDTDDNWDDNEDEEEEEEEEDDDDDDEVELINGDVEMESD